MYNDVIQHTGTYQAFAPIEERRQFLRDSEDRITVTDFGAGSHTGAGQQRRLRDVARTAAKPPALAQLLFRLANWQQPRTVLELGTSLGLTTAYLAAADSRARVITFEGCPETSRVARETFAALHLHNVELVSGNLDATLTPTLQHLQAPLDFAFFDGNHRYEPTLRYFEQCLAHRTDHSLFVLDDIHWSAEMERAWAAVQQHPAVSLTIDLFYVGLIFFRPNQPKQHFTLRFDHPVDRLLERAGRLSA
ncbi:class I SAM-dependent methyltransferase [Hymenobacter sp. NBH84]|uniref:O-methyltransferase n=1 Tax=Hymenobacter sp. NBH84 TaxID=2596915 RepID=UPI0027E4C6F0|nr:class I SAM-dependent methyltransferase [Hymenobacter sp. NBH84]